MPANEVVELLARMNLAAAAAIAVVLVLRKPARRLFGARLAYALWALPILAAVAMLVPARRVVVASPQAAAPPPPVTADVWFPTPVIAEAPGPDPASLILVLWAVGVVAAALMMAYLQRRFMAEARKGAIGPAVVGVVAPRIITPEGFEANFSTDERALVLAHEEAHIARQDSRLNALSAAIQCLFWFNPLVHLAAHLARIDQELACDETVVTRFPNARGDYARALVKAQLAIRPLPLGCYWPSGTEHPLFERIAMLKLKNVGPGRRLAGASVLGLLAAVSGFAAWAAQPTVTVYAGASDMRRLAVEIPEMRPTGVMIPAYGSHPPGTPPALINATTPEMTPTGAMRVVLEPAAELQQTPALVQPPAGYAIDNGLTRAESGGERVTVEGSLVRVMFVNPQAMITIRDASGQEVTVATETPNSLIRQGLNRETLRAGMQLRMDGFRAPDGTIHARAAAFSSNGQRIATSDNQGNPLPTLQAPGAVTDRSPLSNSVVREGAQRPTVIVPPESAAPRPSVVTSPTWEKMPGGDEISAVYPERAMRLERSGSVVLSCDVQPSGAVSGCTVVSETPVGLGFGEAAKRLEGSFRMKPTTPNGSPVGGSKVHIPVGFSLN